MAVVRTPHLVNAEIVAEGTVVNAFDPVISTEPGADRDRIGPAVVQRAGAVGHHQAEAVEGAVGEHAAAPALADGLRIRRNVDQAVERAEAVVGDVQAVDGVLGARRFVEAAPQGEGRIAGHRVVHPHAGEVNVLRFGSIAAGIEAHGAEIVPGDAAEHVVLVEEDHRTVPEAAFVHFKLFHPVLDGLGRHGADRDAEQILHVPVVDRHVDAGFQVLRGLDDQVVQAVGQVAEKETAGRIGGDGPDFAGALVQDDACLRDGVEVASADDRSLDSAGLGG